MPEHRYPRPPIDVAALFQPPAVEEPFVAPAWWPTDKAREVTFQPPLSTPAPRWVIR